MNCSNISIKVSKDSTGDFTSINEAISNAKEDSVIYVSGGVYNESINVSKKISIIGDSDNKVIIKPSSDKPCSISNNAHIENLYFESGITEVNNKDELPLLTVNGSCSISDCLFNNGLNTGFAIFGGNVDIKECNFFNNKNNIRIWNHASVSMKDCNITDAKDVGLYLDNDCYVVLNYCNVINSLNDNIQVWGASGIVLKNSNISHSKNYGLTYEEYTDFNMTNTTMEHNEKGDINKVSE